MCVSRVYLSSFRSRERHRRSVTLIIGFTLHRQFIDTVITPYVSYYYYKLYNTSRWSLPHPLLFYNIIVIQQPPPPLPPPSILWFVLWYNIIFIYLNILFVFSKYCYYYNNTMLYAIKNTKLKRLNVYFSLITFLAASGHNILLISFFIDIIYYTFWFIY